MAWAPKIDSHKTSTSGFTIIEVVLVLAIAGLIFLIVFLALPALQRSQRDNQRKADMGRLFALIDGHKANNGGIIFCNSLFQGVYMADTFAARTERYGSITGTCPEGFTLLANEPSFSATPSDSATPTNYGYTDPSGTSPVPVITIRNIATLETNFRPQFRMGTKCGSSGESQYIAPVNNAGMYALLIRLENGGYYCVDNS